jgi:uncharacterized delta-60 repeat protein
LFTVAAFLTLGLGHFAQATDGDLDPSFGTGGLVVLENSEQDVLNAVAIQPDGKIVVAGLSGPFDTTLPDAIRADNDIVVARFDPNGQLDPAFGISRPGLTTTDLVPGERDNDTARALVLQQDGKLVVAGISALYDLSVPNKPSRVGRLAVVRYTGVGSPDPEFGSGGVSIPAIPDSADSSAHAAVLQDDGKIVVAGGIVTTGGSRSFLLVRFNGDGSLDNGFGTNGIVTTDFVSTGADFALSVVVQSDGKIVAAGVAGRLPGSPQIGDFGLARYNTDGSPDTTFDGDGRVTTDFGPQRRDEAVDLVVQPDGKIVAAGTSIREESFVFALARYNPDGSLDTGFGRRGNGTQMTSFPDGTDGTIGAGGAGGDPGGSALALLPGGKLVAAGTRAFGDTQDEAQFALIRYQPNGREDTTFGEDVFGEDDLEPEGVLDGIKFTSFGENLIARAVAMTQQPDGKLVLVGRFNPNCPSCGPKENAFALARYQSSVIPATVTCQGLAATIIGTPGDDRPLVGASRADVIAGLGGNDQIIAQDGDDIICGGAGDDLVFAGSGSDSVEGNEGNDELNGDIRQDGEPGNDVLRGNDGNDILFGELGNDILEGGAGRDTLLGGSGRDELLGGKGKDLLNGGPGNDVIRGGRGRDRIVGDLPGEIGDDRIFGGKGDDTLFGGEGQDTIRGQGGRDKLVGEGGTDSADGGAGRDSCFSAEKTHSCEGSGSQPRLPKRGDFPVSSSCAVPQCGG